MPTVRVGGVRGAGSRPKSGAAPDLESPSDDPARTHPANAPAGKVAEVGALAVSLVPARRRAPRARTMTPSVLVLPATIPPELAPPVTTPPPPPRTRPASVPLVKGCRGQAVGVFLGAGVGLVRYLDRRVGCQCKHDAKYFQFVTVSIWALKCLLGISMLEFQSSRIFNCILIARASTE